MTQDEIVKRSNITIQIGLDKEQIPASIGWKADDNPNQQSLQECKAMLISLFDRESKDTLKIDLWTKDMQVTEMDRFFFQTLRALADTYFKATQNAKLASDLQRFVQHFGEQTEILPKSSQ
ncbi:MAG: gliding motility protein GldC [Saprospiraceae bacterium]|nr:gliding motility protein GldC [Saprospiraceae bacterium]